MGLLVCPSHCNNLGYTHHEDNPLTFLEACLSYLCDSPSRLIMVNIEDLWLELNSQNVPIAGAEIPNWRRKAKFSWEESSL